MSFITTDELALFYPQSTDYDTPTINNALSSSYGLVNAYLNTQLIVPSGTGSPYILKIAQSQFARYLLDFGNVGEVEDVRALYDNTVKMVRGITQNELSIPKYTQYATTAGFNITEESVQDTGTITVRKGAPQYNCNYKLVCTTGGQTATGLVKFSVYRDDNITSPLVTGVTASIVYANVLGAYSGSTPVDALEISFTGAFTAGDYFIISASPYDTVNETLDDMRFVQGYINY